MSVTYNKEVVLPKKFQSEISENGNVGKFVIYPLQKGFGITLGNSIRRVLLSTIRGIAIEKLEIEGIGHEFTTINGIIQDASEIIFNLKKIVFSSELEECVLDLTFNGPKKIFSSDVVLPAGVKIINTDLFLFEITSNIAVKMKLHLRAGVADFYVDLDSNQFDKRNELGVIRLDCHFNPVLRVSFDVVDTRLDKKTDYDKLILNVETNGAISAENALVSSISVLSSFLNSISSVKFNIANNVSEVASLTEDSNKAHYDYNLLRKTSDLELSVRSQNCLKLEGIEYVGDLVSRTENDMLKTTNFGRKSLNELKNVLARMKLQFGMDIEWKPKNFKSLLEEAGKFFESE